MFDEPEETPRRPTSKPADRAKDKSDEFRMHAELCAIFEGNRKFDAGIHANLDPQIARDSQKTIGRLEKSRQGDGPLISDQSAPDAAKLLDLPNSSGISTNDYHIYRRPGEVMMMRWLAGDQVDSFYTRIQAHFDAALTQCREDERQTHGWKQDPDSIAYLAALDAIDVKMEDKYLRQILRQHKVFALSTQTTDEMDIFHLCDFIMGIPAVEIVGEASAPPDEPTEQDRAWFMKIFSLRGMMEGEERMCFFTYLQKTDETF
ncbi:MAG TPA: hypothetical protein VHD56_14055 [Tepidisphaeraceae bacterium]|nr:hypothetical protein [Tepidisphaeraceae bacterium]